MFIKVTTQGTKETIYVNYDNVDWMITNKLGNEKFTKIMFSSGNFVVVRESIDEIQQGIASIEMLKLIGGK